MKTLFILVLLFAHVHLHSQQITYQEQVKQRVIVLTDITNEPDDQESLVRLLVYSNEFDIEGLIATTSVHLKSNVRQDKIEELINAYEKVNPNLHKHASGFPSAQYLRSVTKSHLPQYGMSGVGIDKDTEGSELIVRQTDKDDSRPLWISVWGGANCLAQALWKVRETRSKEDLDIFLSKIRVYAISDQDDSGRWIRTNFPNIFYIVSPSAESWLEYYRATWTGISGDRRYKNAPMYKFDMVDNPWLTENVINNHGPLGALYPKLDYIMEGDTPSFIGLINNGLGSAISPSYGGWSGRYELFQSYAEAGKIWTNNENTADEVTLEDGKTYVSDQATIWRWREAFQNDFAARMDWCVADVFSKANHNPSVTINGNQSKDVVLIKAAHNQKIILDASRSYDIDKNTLSYKWYVYKEAGNFKGNILLSPSGKENVTFDMPALKSGESIHLICEVRDNGNPSLSSYRRIVFTH